MEIYWQLGDNRDPWVFIICSYVSLKFCGEGTKIAGVLRTSGLLKYNHRGYTLKSLTVVA